MSFYMIENLSPLTSFVCIDFLSHPISLSHSLAHSPYVYNTNNINCWLKCMLSTVLCSLMYGLLFFSLFFFFFTHSLNLSFYDGSYAKLQVKINVSEWMTLFVLVFRPKMSTWGHNLCVLIISIHWIFDINIADISKGRKLVHNSVLRVKADVKKKKKKNRAEKKSMSNANRIERSGKCHPENRWCFECHSNGAHLENFFHIINIVSLKKIPERHVDTNRKLLTYTHTHIRTTHSKIWWRMTMVKAILFHSSSESMPLD